MESPNKIEEMMSRYNQKKIDFLIAKSSFHTDIMDDNFIENLDQDLYIKKLLNLTLEEKQVLLFVIALKYSNEKALGVLKSKLDVETFFKTLSEKTSKYGVINLFALPCAMVDRNGPEPKYNKLVNYETPITSDENWELYRNKFNLVYTALHRAAELDANEEAINIILSQGVEIDRYNSRFETPLNIAINRANLRAFLALVNAGAYVYPEGAKVFNCFIWPPLARTLSHSISPAKREIMLRKLLSAGASVNTICFHGKFPVYFMALASLNHMSSSRFYNDLVIFLNKSDIDLTLQTQDFRLDKPKFITMLDFVAEEDFVIYPPHKESFENQNLKIRKLVQLVICNQIALRLQSIVETEGEVSLGLTQQNVRFPQGLVRLIAEYQAEEDLTMKYGTSEASLKFLSELPRQTTILSQFQKRLEKITQEVSDVTDVVESSSFIRSTKKRI